MVVGVGEACDVELAAEREIVRHTLGDAEEMQPIVGADPDDRAARKAAPVAGSIGLVGLFDRVGVGRVSGGDAQLAEHAIVAQRTARRAARVGEAGRLHCQLVQVFVGDVQMPQPRLRRTVGAQAKQGEIECAGAGENNVSGVGARPGAVG